MLDHATRELSVIPIIISGMSSAGVTPGRTGIVTRNEEMRTDEGGRGGASSGEKVEDFVRQRCGMISFKAVVRSTPRVGSFGLIPPNALLSFSVISTMDRGCGSNQIWVALGREERTFIGCQEGPSR